MHLASPVQWHSCSQKKNNKYLCWTDNPRGEKIRTWTVSGLENIKPGFLTLWVNAFIQKAPLMPQLSSMTLNKNNNGSTTWSPESSSGALSTRRAWSCWSGSRGRPQKWSEDWSSSPTRKGWESWGCSAWRREGCRKDLIAAFQYLKGACRKDGNKL